MEEYQISQLQVPAAKNVIRCCNELNRQYGLTLTEDDITELFELRKQALSSTA